MSDLLLYGIDADGETAYTLAVARQDHASLRRLAATRLNEYHAVEVWDGPLCVVRLRRRVDEQA